MLAELMQHWGTEGLDSHLSSLQTVYKRRAQLMHESAKQVPARLSAVTAACSSASAVAVGILSTVWLPWEVCSFVCLV